MGTVRSADGTQIAFERQGQGPPVLFVHGGLSSGEAWSLVTPHLRSRFSIVTMDRRGRGVSGDGVEYSLDLEAADVAAVADAVGERIHLVAHSSGAVVALRTAPRLDGLRSLTVYEPPVGNDHWPDDLWDRIEELVESGSNDAATELFARHIATPREIEALRATPAAWVRLRDSIQVAPREGRALVSCPLDLHEVSRIDAPTLLLVGEGTTSPVFLGGLEELEAALPDVRRVELPGQRHLANGFAPDVLADRIGSFLESVDAAAGRWRRPG